VKPTDPTDLGDQYVFTGIDATRRAIISYLVGKRDGENANVQIHSVDAARRPPPRFPGEGRDPLLPWAPAFAGVADLI
jgi:hypothetical protein